MIGGYIGLPIGGAPRAAINVVVAVVDTHDGFGPTIRPRRVRSQPSKKEYEYQLAKALREMEEAQQALREAALLSGQIAQQEAAKLLAQQALANAQRQANLLARKRDDEDAIALLMVMQ